MKKIDTKSFSSFAHLVSDKFNFLLDMPMTFNEPEISIIAKYEETRQIIEELIKIGYKIRSIESLDFPEINDYYDEYIITIANIDIDYEIWCQPMKKNDYFSVEGDMIFVLDNCNSKVVPFLHSEFICKASIGETDEKTSE